MQQVPGETASFAQFESKTEQVAATYQLGTFLTTYRNKVGLVRFMVFWPVYLGIVGTVIFFASPDINGAWWGWLIWVVFLLLMALLLLFLLAHAVSIRVLVYTEGLIYSRKNRLEVIRWDQVEAYWEDTEKIQDAPEYPGDKTKSFSYRVRRTDGTTFEFPNDIKQIQTLGEHIRQNTERYLLPRTLAAYYAGASISFGDINVNFQEINVGGGRATLLWSDFESFDLDETILSDETELMIYLYRKGQRKAWYRRRVAEIANPGVLQRLLDTIVQERVLQQLPQAIASYKSGSPINFGRISLSLQGIEVDGGKQSLPWKDVKSVDVDIKRRQVSIYTYSKLLSWQTFPTWMTPDSHLLKELVNVVLQEQKYHTEAQVQSQLPQLIASYNAGMPLTFGRLSLSLQGVAIDGGKQFLPWHQVSRMYVGTYIGGDRLTIGKKGNILLAWQTLLLSELGDVELLKEVIEYVMSGVH